MPLRPQFPRARRGGGVKPHRGRERARAGRRRGVRFLCGEITKLHFVTLYGAVMFMFSV